MCCIATPESPASMRVTVFSDASMRAARSFCVHWRLRRVYGELRLNLPRRGKKRLPARIRQPLLAAVQPIRSKG